LKTEVETPETQPDEDLSEAHAEISSELFGQDGEEENKDEKPLVEGEEAEPSGGAPEAKADAVEPPPQPEEKPAEENAEEVQATGAPKTWTKEALAEWATIPPRAQTEILKREEDFLRGITQYKEAAELGAAYSKVVEPYMPVLAAENVNPIGLFQSFAANHYLLSRGSDEQKVELAAQLINGYNIPLGPLLNFMAESGETRQPDPEVVSLRRELNDLKFGLNNRSQAEHNARIEDLGREIDAFAADTAAHPYFDEVANDIHNLFKAGLAKDLTEAYEKAVYANPVTRAKEIDRLTAERASKADYRR
jgi:hypothetical protein